MCDERRRSGPRVWAARATLAAAAAAFFVIVLAGVAMADNDCSAGNEGDCRNTAEVIGTIATITAVLTISVAGLTNWSKEWTAKRCVETMKSLDADIDQALAKARTLMAERDQYRQVYATTQDMKAAEMAHLANSHLEEMVRAVDDLYARRQAVMEGCGPEKIDPGKWARAKPPIGRLGVDRTGAPDPFLPVTQVAPPRTQPGPVPLGHLTRPGEGGSASVNPDDIKKSVTGIIDSGKVPPPFDAIVKAVGPGVDKMIFKPTPDGGVTVDVAGHSQPTVMGRKLGDPIELNGSVQLGVRNGQLTAGLKGDLPLPLMPFSGTIDGQLSKAVDSFNRSLWNNNLEIKSFSVGPDGHLQIKTGPR